MENNRNWLYQRCDRKLPTFPNYSHHIKSRSSNTPASNHPQLEIISFLLDVTQKVRRIFQKVVSGVQYFNDDRWLFQHLGVIGSNVIITWTSKYDMVFILDGPTHSANPILSLGVWSCITSGLYLKVVIRYPPTSQYLIYEVLEKSPAKSIPSSLRHLVLRAQKMESVSFSLGVRVSTKLGSSPT